LNTKDIGLYSCLYTVSVVEPEIALQEKKGKEGIHENLYEKLS
jgi:hypothetical protein